MKHWKKRLASLALAMVLALGLVPYMAPEASAIGGFSDVTDMTTAQNVEVLQMMGVVDGMSSGVFNPMGTLTRAQFCKMAVEAMGQGDRANIYQNYTIFPDVKPGYWAAGYVNLAVRSDPKLISGYADGTFGPNNTINYGQAVTILMRMLGYKDEDVSAVWPDGYIDQAMAIGLCDGVSLSAGTAVNRAQAAQLFMNLLNCDQKEGGKFYTKLGTPVDAILLDGNAKDAAGNPILRTSVQDYVLAGNPGSGLLSGRKGVVILNGAGEAVTFVPTNEGTSRNITIAMAETTTITNSSGTKYSVAADAKEYIGESSYSYVERFTYLSAGTLATLYINDKGRVETVFVGSTTSDDAVIVAQDGSTEGFALLTDRTDYTIYKHGERVTSRSLKKFDVATYSASNNTVYVSDNRITVYYQDAYPNAASPSRIKATGIIGTGEDGYLEVMPCAMASLAECRVGQTITLLLTENNKVAGVSTNSAARGNAIGFVGKDGVRLFNGLEVDSSAIKNLSDYTGQLVSVSSSNRDSVTLGRVGGQSIRGDFYVSEGRVGSAELAADVQIYTTAQGNMLSQVALSDLTENIISSDQVLFAHKNYADKVDILVLENTTGDSLYYGRVFVSTTVNEAGETTKVETSVQSSSGEVAKFEVDRGLSTGQWIGVSVRSDNSQIVTQMVVLKAVKNVPASAWRGGESVYVNGKLYTVSSGLDNCCYDKDAGVWFRNLNAALASGGSVTIMVDNDNVIRGVEVSH
mgnify:FL=1